MARTFSLPGHLDNASSPHNQGDSLTHAKTIDENSLLDNRFLFQIDKLKQVNFNTISCNIPGLSIGEILRSTPLVDIKEPGDKLNFEPLVIRYKVDGDLENFLILQRWIRGLGFSEGHHEHQNLNVKKLDASISIPLADNCGEKLRIHFKDCYPMALEGLDFDSSSEGIQLQSTATFSYSTYDIYTIPEGEEI